MHGSCAAFKPKLACSSLVQGVPICQLPRFLLFPHIDIIQLHGHHSRKSPFSSCSSLLHLVSLTEAELHGPGLNPCFSPWKTNVTPYHSNSFLLHIKLGAAARQQACC